ncbi:hypothetical protein A3K48_05120 [candidate division WOR-1 bacterium RIFOXYA12_FULL_52_29]|uniref:Uncharacterized protein n=1 Tax=candidate division WOR-1 bacterium RIFOXYC12_FULL_54_18 TaxID=1802584 RepID=A0A1F4T6K1_UNCSA|nr:MAG: hypothetical protein A3K44_05120 [candidate division WOR-1 bacterium RIFOXYA2_FULL_51_19]OGC17927.1 MAG: hypothetical protein A3K48_05120 [candidate division WOR-1 bacterium RIFOXYA12_FULL_52_29]OGC26783.1 MAG: hypothetical protein A3K32_05115 [candidate division WOR-1 bacterium RIFOXYB2_FULL_45_9]OGC28344.1 MAG: hypothetical protein A3K49_05120 [candidate division WOR-1 bacterium RIFOXYC12_FULL_54_18]OGC31200.1 MAG: hypothetical protein A2346_07500 [candidate division WOR-1 bacterium R
MKTINCAVKFKAQQLTAMLLFLCLAAPALAVPSYLNYQGVLRDDQGRLVTGTKELTFKLYDVATAGTALWTMASPEVVVSNGLYNVQLGPLGYTELASGRRWLEITIGTETLSPRLEILSVAYAVTAGQAESATTLGGYSPAATGSGSFIPVTTSGKLDASVIPVSSGGNADTVDSFHANSTATAGQILPLDDNKQFKGMSVSAEASGNNYALFVNGGKLGVKTGSNMIAGTGTITSGVTFTDIANTSVTSNSIILLSIGNNASANTNGGIRVSLVSNGVAFRVATLDGNNASANIPFSYFIIN